MQHSALRHFVSTPGQMPKRDESNPLKAAPTPPFHRAKKWRR